MDMERSSCRSGTTRPCAVVREAEGAFTGAPLKLCNDCCWLCEGPCWYMFGLGTLARD